ncbi:ABC transporter permease [Rhodococcus sp. Eu-32]|uniref:ABC transporter permease n=1 Tax=Rhodococcus sp. Eu-32 TaxID=1017319 RepID=UPI000DF363A3|nr:ABC transporter permease [Rhodococcus sp. Eu-32]RRQ26893.1 ABC transporter permease [Rhodococcus sp. Eu-32]
MKRTLDVARMHTVAWPLIIGWPVGILALSFAICYAIFALIPTTDAQFNFTGAVFSVYGFAVAFYIQAITQTFPFAVGLSVTRREFYTASALVGVIQSAALATVLFALSALEAATGGFGVKLRMFGIFRYATDSAALEWAALFATLLLVTTIGLFIGVVYQHYRVNGLFGLLLVGIVLFGGGAILITWQRWWPDVIDFVVDTPRYVVLAVIPLTLGIAFTGAGWTGIRRATA